MTSEKNIIYKKFNGIQVLVENIFFLTVFSQTDAHYRLTSFTVSHYEYVRKKYQQSETKGSLTKQGG